MSVMLLTNTMVTGPVLFGDKSASSSKIDLKKTFSKISSLNAPTQAANSSSYSKLDYANYTKAGKTVLNTSFAPKASQDEVMMHLKSLSANPEKQAMEIVDTFLASGKGIGTNENGMKGAAYSINGQNIKFVDKFMQEKLGVSFKLTPFF